MPDALATTNDLVAWMERQHQRCAELMPRAISATRLVKKRRAFG